MTNRDYLISILGHGPSPEAIEGALIDSGLIGIDEYVFANSLTLKRAGLRSMELLLTTADTTNENGYTIKYDRGAVLKRIGWIKTELGIENGEPTITSATWW